MISVLDDVLDTFGWWTIPLAPLLLVGAVIGLVLTAVLSSQRAP